MKFKKLGNSGLILSDLTLGTMLYGEESSRSTPPEIAKKQIDFYLDRGGNHIDTADVYANGRSEEILGQALLGKRHRTIIATKVRFPRGQGPNDSGLSRHHIIQEVHASLRRLSSDYIDIYYMHCWDPITPIEESLRAFDDLLTAGKVRYIGVSNFKAWQVMKAQGVSELNGYTKFVAGQYQYSLIKRDIEYEFKDLFESEGIGLLPWGPLGGGFLSGKYRSDQKPTDEGRIATTGEETEEAWKRRDTTQNWKILEEVQKIAQNREVSSAQIAIAWLRSQDWVSSVILGARTFEQLEDNMKSADINLTLKEQKDLNKASELPELYPYRMMDVYGQRFL
ncbi:MAG: aldo/keto reductase [Microscillaceae bacterium]|nr:aldo/keto reductase [Microscillaceae bacterium]